MPTLSVLLSYFTDISLFLLYTAAELITLPNQTVKSECLFKLVKIIWKVYMHALSNTTNTYNIIYNNPQKRTVMFWVKKSMDITCTLK